MLLTARTNGNGYQPRMAGWSAECVCTQSCIKGRAPGPTVWSEDAPRCCGAVLTTSATPCKQGHSHALLRQILECDSGELGKEGPTGGCPATHGRWVHSYPWPQPQVSHSPALLRQVKLLRCIEMIWSGGRPVVARPLSASHQLQSPGNPLAQAHKVVAQAPLPGRAGQGAGRWSAT